MAQSFDCLCGTPTCRGKISGAKDMTPEQLKGLWINGHIRELLEEKVHGNGATASCQEATGDPTAQALRDALKHAEKVVEAARLALQSYTESSQAGRDSQSAHHNAAAGLEFGGDHARQGPTSRELSGEMGGDTAIMV